MISLKKKSISFFLIALTILLSACSKKVEIHNIICQYDDLECLYHDEIVYKQYRYNDYIYDDVSSGEYILSTPNVADYLDKTGEVDVPRYADAWMDYSIKMQIAELYDIELQYICDQIKNGYFEQKNSKVYFYDKLNNINKLLYDDYVTNIVYDDGIPLISFDINEIDEEELSVVKGRKMKLSDILASNSTIDNFMKVVLSKGKKKLIFYMGDIVDNDENSERYKSKTEFESSIAAINNNLN